MPSTLKQAEEQGQRDLKRARKRFGGLLTQTLPPGLVDNTENVEINEKDIIAHRYREAYESVKSLISRMFINKMSENLRSCAEKGAQEGNTDSAWDAARGVAGLRALGFWHRCGREIREETERHFEDQTLISNVAEDLRSHAAKGARERDDGSAWNAIRDSATLRVTGIWGMISRQKREEIEGYMQSPTFIHSVAKGLRLAGSEGAKKGNTLYALNAAEGAIALRAIGLWDEFDKETRGDFEEYIESQTLINNVVEGIYRGAGNRNTSFTAKSVVALKFLAEYYKMEAEKIRSAQGAEAARKPQSGENASSMLPTRKF